MNSCRRPRVDCRAWLAACHALLCVATCVQAATEAGAAPQHDLSVSLDPATRRLEGRDLITFASRRSAALVIGRAMQIDSITADGQAIAPRQSSGRDLKRVVLPAALRVEVKWSGTLAALDTAIDHRATLTGNAPVAGAQGSFLPAGSGWYPMVEGALERYRVRLDLPAGQTGMVPGRLLEERTEQGRYRAQFEFDAPSEGITLVAGPYRVEERNIRTALGSEVRLRTYFHAEIATLSAGYLDSVAGYLDLYEKQIGAYPFAAFSVVSSPTPTGFGMPTMTYLGIDVLRLPFIRATSLGHEVLHNWWGNGVYPDFAHGNWSEGLTTFMADYAYKEREGEQAALDARLAWLRDYAAMPRGDDRPLAGFTSRTHGASQIVGYHKSAMLFAMLRDDIGAAAFERGLQRFWRERRFQVASWNDLRAAFEHEAGRSLKTFFDQWLVRAGAPDLHIVDVRAVDVRSEVPRAGGAWRASITLTQGKGGAPYALSVPLLVRTAQGESSVRVPLAAASATVNVDLPGEPLAVLLDPQMRLFRRLAAGEAPPILRQAMLTKAPALLVLGGADDLRRAAGELAGQLFEQTPRTASTRSGSGTLMVAGTHADVDAWLAKEQLPPRPAALAAGSGSAQVWMVNGPVEKTADKPADKDAASVILVVSARDAKSVSELLRPLPHYGQQSFVVFDGAHAVARGVWPPEAQGWRRGG
jgi:aminopeptidase N